MIIFVPSPCYEWLYFDISPMYAEDELKEYVPGNLNWKSFDPSLLLCIRKLEQINFDLLCIKHLESLLLFLPGYIA